MIIASHGKTGGGIKGRTNHRLKSLHWWMRGMEVNLTDIVMLKHPVCLVSRLWLIRSSLICLSSYLLLFFECSPTVGYLSRIFMCKHSVIVKSCFLFHHYHLNCILPKLSSLFPPAGFNGADKLQRLLWWAQGFGSLSVSFDIFPKTALDTLSSAIKKQDFMLKGTDWWLCGFHNLFFGWLQ